MLEVSRVGVAESDDEIELSLELSIGGSYGKLEKLKHVEDSGKESEKSLEAVVPRSGFPFPETIVGDQMDTESGSGSEVVDSQRKREIQALRRQEARRKREEKMRKSAAKGINGGAFCVGVANANDKVWLEAQQLQARAQDREMRENGALFEDSTRKKDKIAKCVANENGKDSNFTFRNDGSGSEDHGSGSKPAVSFLQNVPVIQMQGPYPQSQCLPPKNGFVYPYMVPCRDPNVGKEENETKRRNTFQPVTCGSFRPYANGNGNMKHDSGTGCDSEHNSGKSGSGVHKVMSNGSLERTSSAISDHRSTSGKGGSSSEARSHSSYFRANEQQFGVSAINDRSAQPESSASSDKKESGQAPIRAADRSQRGTVDVSGNVKPVAPTSKPEEPPSTLRQTRSAEATFTPSLPEMPCVSTTGNGPNGKTITGFLYRYTKTEVSIVCVCHGSSFSPAEFVEHAGGTDITHPLRHITMIPSSFG